MSVVPLTIIVSLCLVFSFVVFFLREHARGRLSSAERDSLLPLSEETPRLARMPSAFGADEDRGEGGAVSR
jgi:hypothetical protein